ncbi:class I SAM-dependent methyltransferase [Nocardioides sp.]|uniref:class I SAM-dependent methyltransferase n=1 Tax=Nocardioides sp. TaxID=35761 RepID=UPI003D095B10
MIEIWNAEAATYDQEPDHGLADPVTRHAWRDLLCGVLPAPPARVADLGCGTGTLSRLLVDQGYAVTGLDFAPEMLVRAAAKVPEATFVLGDAARPPLERSAYDVVLSRHVLWAMPDPVAALSNWLGLLRPGGSAVLVEGNWSTGAGLSAEQALSIATHAGAAGVVTPLPEAVYWGKEITDERYLLIAAKT